MERVNNIINDSAFKTELSKIDNYEKGRIYCGHGISHLMDTARIAYIHALENACVIDKEVIYAAALLHDIGRGRQYETGESHDTAGASIAEDILHRSGFAADEIRLILSAITCHRGSTSIKADTGEFAAIIKTADNESRLCFLCSAADTCKWNDNRKNHKLSI